jgi:hypothetical protein
MLPTGTVTAYLLRGINVSQNLNGDPNAEEEDRGNSLNHIKYRQEQIEGSG